MRSRWIGWTALLIGILPAAFASAADPPAKASEPAILVDAAGKEIKLTGLKFGIGARRLAFLADAKGTTDDARKGPLALGLREPHSTTFQKGVITLIPLSSIAGVKYDYAKLSMSVAVAGQPGVAGTLEFRGINVLILEAKAGDVPAKFTGGAKGGFQSIAFPGARPLSPRPAASKWSVQIVQPTAMDPTLTVSNLKALYSFPGGAEQLADTLPVRKGKPLQMNAKIKRLEIVAVDPNTKMAAMELLVEGETEGLIAVPLTLEQGKRTGLLTGFVGEVDCGWKFFPLHTVKVIQPAK